MTRPIADRALRPARRLLPPGRRVRRPREGRRRPHPVGRDGRHFVPNLTFGPDVIASIRPHVSVPFEAHLMVERPDDLLARYVEAGCELDHRPRRGVPPPAPHAGPHPRARRVTPRSPSTRTPPSRRVEHVLDLVDLVLVMTVNPGFGGQAYIATMEPKIAEVAARRDGPRPRLRHRGRRRHRARRRSPARSAPAPTCSSPAARCSAIPRASSTRCPTCAPVPWPHRR